MWGRGDLGVGLREWSGTHRCGVGSWERGGQQLPHKCSRTPRRCHQIATTNTTTSSGQDREGRKTRLLSSFLGRGTCFQFARGPHVLWAALPPRQEPGRLVIRRLGMEHGLLGTPTPSGLLADDSPQGRGRARRRQTVSCSQGPWWPASWGQATSYSKMKGVAECLRAAFSQRLWLK